MEKVARTSFVRPYNVMIWPQMVGIWCLCTWQQLGCPASLRLVELGPGRGTLMADLLRGTAPFAAFASALQASPVPCALCPTGEPCALCPEPYRRVLCPVPSRRALCPVP